MSDNKRDWKKVSKTVAAAAGLTAGTLGAVQVLRQQKKPVSQAVVVLGSGQSGTSVLAHAVEYLGVDLGENVLSGERSITKESFEDQKIVSVHKNMNIGKRPFEKGWQKRKTVKAYKTTLKNYIQANFLHKPLWGWKDPRTNDFIEMWQEILQELRVEPLFLIIVRHPRDVVASSKRAYQRDEEWDRLQWQIRTLSALRHTYGSQRAIVTYDELFGDPLECLRRIATQLQIAWPEDEGRLKQQLANFINPSQQTRQSDKSAQEDAAFPQDALDLYDLCLQGSQSQGWLQSKDFQSQVDRLYEAYLDEHGKLSRKPPEYTGNLP